MRQLVGSLRLNVAAGWFSHMLALCTGLLLMPFILHTLGDSRYGHWLFISAVAGYASLLNLGFARTIGRYVAEYVERRDWVRLNGVVNLVLFIYLGMGALILTATGILAWLAPHLHEWGELPLTEVRLVILVMGLNAALQIIGAPFGSVLVGIQRFDLDGLMSFVACVMRLGLTLLCLQAERGLLIMSLIVLSLTLAELLSEYMFARRLLPQLSIHWRHLRKSTVHECLSFSGFALLNDLSYRLLYETDSIIIGVVFGAEKIVPFMIASRLCQFLCKPVQHVARVCMPRAGQLHASTDRGPLRNMVVRVTGFAWLLTASLFIGVAFFGDVLIDVWIGTGRNASYVLLLVLLSGQLIATPCTMLRSILFGIGEARFPALVYVLEAVCNCVLTLILIKPLGLLGVALGTAIPVIVFELGVLLPRALVLLKVSSAELIRHALGPQLLPLIGLWAYCFLIDTRIHASGGWPALCLVASGGAAIVASCWLLMRLMERWWAHSTEVLGNPAGPSPLS